MKATHRAYDEKRDDFEKMQRFLFRDYARKQTDFVWMYSRLCDWKYGLYGGLRFFPMYCRRNVELWFDPFGDLAAFLISESGNSTINVFTEPGYDYLTGEILDWALQQWSDRGPLRSEVHEAQAACRGAMEARGFVNRGGIGTTRKYDLAIKALEPVTLPEGYRIVDMIENRDFRGKQVLRRNAFGNSNEVTDLDIWAYEYSRESPAYDAGYDLSVIDETGRHVAAAEGFVDYANSAAEVERICTHSDFRRRGFAEAAVRACFHRLHANGVTYAYILGYSDEANGLYAKLGPCDSRQWFLYEQE
jgi:ribosomal protein S18 acetylase RimI-like enzyme